MWNPLYFTLLLICLTFGWANGQKSIKFLVLVEENAQMDLKNKLASGLAAAEKDNIGFTFEMRPVDVG